MGIADAWHMAKEQQVFFSVPPIKLSSHCVAFEWAIDVKVIELIYAWI